MHVVLLLYNSISELCHPEREPVHRGPLSESEACNSMISSQTLASGISVLEVVVNTSRSVECK